jgi:nitroreductase
MNETIKKQLSHRSIRAFSEKAVPKDVVDTLLAVANRTATSSGLQFFVMPSGSNRWRHRHAEPARLGDRYDRIR